MIAPCGLDCSACDIRQAPNDPQLAEDFADWFRAHVDPKAEASWFRCGGCLGDRDIHWSPDCWILACCVDKKGLRYCSKCAVFPCHRLEEWSIKSEKYTQAFRRLGERRSAKARGDSSLV